MTETRGNDYSHLIEGITDYDIALTQYAAENNCTGTEYRLYVRGGGAELRETVVPAGGNSFWGEERDGLVHVYSLSGMASVKELSELLAPGGRAAVLIDAVIAGHDWDYDKTGKLRGTLTEDAEEASSELKSLLGGLWGNSLKHCFPFEVFGYHNPSVLEDFDLQPGASDEEIEEASFAMRDYGVDSFRRAMPVSDCEYFLRGCLATVREEESEDA